MRNKRDKNHDRAKQLIEGALRGEYGRIYTSDYIADEAITTALARTHNHQIAVNTGRYVIESPRIEKIHINEEQFQLAWQKFQRLKQKPMSFTDCTSLALMEKHGIARLMSFDSEFDGLVPRIH